MQEARANATPWDESGLLCNSERGENQSGACDGGGTGGGPTPLSHQRNVTEIHLQVLAPELIARS